MAFYDDIGKKLTRTRDEAVQKTKNYAEIARLNSAISELERNISSVYAEIGRTYYMKYAETPENADEEISPFLWKISEFMKEIEESRKEIRQLKGLRLCDSCGKEIGSDAIFCNFCGARQIPVVKAENESMVCANCGAPYKEGYLFCRNCGANLSEMKRATQKRHCESCGAEIEEGMLFCMRCGWKVTWDDEEPRTIRNAAEAEVTNDAEEQEAAEPENVIETGTVTENQY